MVFDWIIQKGTGKLRIKQRSEMDAWISSIAHSEKDVFGTCEWKVRKKKRSLSANSYYWAEIVSNAHACLLEDWGDVLETEMGVVVVNKYFAHEHLLRKCNTDTVVNENGEEMPVTFRTSEGEGNRSYHFWAYVERCKKYIFLQWNVECKEPGEQLTIEDE